MEDLANKDPYLVGKKIVIALSGGIDSVVLFHYLCSNYSGNVRAIHINHHLSKFCDDWSKFCFELCKNNNINFKSIDINIKKSSNIANPGCFALASQLAILPFHSLIKNISITAITGSSGGGKLPSIKNHHSTRSKDIFSYNINKHRHLAEIFQSYPSLNNYSQRNKYKSLLLHQKTFYQKYFWKKRSLLIFFLKDFF